MADEYELYITSKHFDKPKFVATVNTTVEGYVVVQDVLRGMLSATFDLDTAIGKQLDFVGEWAGISRRVSSPISGVYFSFNTAGVGFNEGVWKGPFDPIAGIVELDDDTYRVVIRAKIAANHWDGTMEGSREILDLIFDGTSTAFIEDHQDMTITIAIAGETPSALLLALLTSGRISIKPQSVRIDGYVVPSVPGPLFGFNIQDDLISGFNTGAWAVEYSSL